MQYLSSYIAVNVQRSPTDEEAAEYGSLKGYWETIKKSCPKENGNRMNTERDN